MGIALFTTARLLTPVQTLLSGCVAAASRRFSMYVASASRQLHMTVPVKVPCARPVHPSPHRARLHRPLRVVRVLEGAQGGRTMGRMVISGRMADVCAELDRLAACEGLGS